MVDSSNYLHLTRVDKNLTSSWKGFQFDKEFYDVTLFCDEGSIQAHKFVISSSSKLFKNLLKNNSNEHQIIYMSGVEHKHLKNLIQYMYQGNVRIPEDDLDKFLHLAEDLQIAGLSEENKHVEIKIECNNEPSSNTKYHKEESVDIINDTIDTKENSSVSELNLYFEDKDDTESDNTKSFRKSDSQHKKRLKKIHKLVRQNDSSSKSDKDDVKSDIEKTPCELCGKLYNKRRMRRHNLIHNNLKYPCDQCNTKPYSDPSSLTKHKKAIHKGIRHQCDQCDLSYSARHGLREHKKSVHKGVRYSCDQCNVLPFRYLSHLNRHNKNVHNIV